MTSSRAQDRKIKINALLKKSLEERLADVEAFAPVICQNFRKASNRYFCTCSNSVANHPESCIYRKQDCEYRNQCYWISQDDLKLIYLAKRNHGVIGIDVTGQKSGDGE
jgi:hypothetical protein